MLGEIGGTTPVAPIVHGGCVFALATAPPTFTRICGGVADQTTALQDTSGASLRLRLVNGWIWINDLDTGALWVTSTEGELDRDRRLGHRPVRRRDSDEDTENPDGDDRAT